MATPQSVVDLAREMVRADDAFFRMALRMLDHPANLVNRQLEYREHLIELALTVAEPPREDPPDIRLNFNIPANWNEPVPVVATNAQQAHAMLHMAQSEPPQNCAICQDEIHLGGTELRNCHHRFHRACITTWFTASVRCPVCRNDIREGQEEGA